MSTQAKTVADIEGPWTDPKWESGLIQRLKEAWTKPMDQLTNLEMATLLEQKIAIAYLMPLAESRLNRHFDDDTEIFEGQLKEIHLTIASSQRTTRAADA